MTDPTAYLPVEVDFPELSLVAEQTGRTGYSLELGTPAPKAEELAEAWKKEPVLRLRNLKPKWPARSRTPLRPCRA